MNIIKFAELISFLTNVTGNRFNFETITDIEYRINSIEPVVNKVNLTPMFKAIIDSRKIDAIREHRAITGMGLKESKEEIETIYDIINRCAVPS